MEYQYGILRPDVSAEAERHNNKLLGKNTLGIEITISIFASRCGLGNIDPQHSGEGGSSAIEEALTIPLPPTGTNLVTIRVDKDSLGAMAIIALRAQEKHIDKLLVSWIGILDRMGFPNACAAHPEFIKIENLRGEVDAIQFIVNKTSILEEKVYEISRILTGEMPRREINAIASLKQRNRENFKVEMHGNVAFIMAPGKYRQARDWGNRQYSVAVIFDPEHPVNGGHYARWSVIRKLGKFDRDGFEEMINASEAQALNMPLDEMKKQGYGWGGPKNIVSSSQRTESLLSQAKIIGIARKCAESGIVS